MTGATPGVGPERPTPLGDRNRTALRFVLMVGVLSFFADFTYEGARSVLGPYLALLGASGLLVGLIAGVGELLGYGLRLASGRWADATGQLWPITIFGYGVQMASVPLLALTSTWKEAAALIILERIGKAIRNPPRDVMLSYAARQAGGYGWAFGAHEAMDQFGALFGPLAVAVVLARHGSFHQAFAVLAIPAALNLGLVLLARATYPRPRELDAGAPEPDHRRLPPRFWIYLAGAGLAAAGFADYSLIAFHFAKTHLFSGQTIATFYAVAMGVSGTGALAFGRLFDRHGFKVLVGLTLISTLFAPLVFFGGFALALAGAALWGLGMGVQESIIPAAVAPMAPAGRRASTFGLFTAAYGVAWFVGSGLIGWLYDQSVAAACAFCVAAELAAIPFFVWVGRRNPRAGAA